MSDDQEIKLDIRGQICPSCLLMGLKAVNSHKHKLQEGETSLKIVTDNRQATTTIPEAMRNMGYDTIVDKQQGHYEITISAHKK